MKLLQGMQVLIALLAFEVCILSLGLAQPTPNVPGAAASALLPVSPGSVTPARAFPGLRLADGLEVTYLGMFSPDAVYRKVKAFDGQVAGEGIPPAGQSGTGPLSSGAPPWMLLSSERTVEDLEPPGHAKGTLTVHSHTGAMRNHFVTSIYGRASVLYSPMHITTDSQQRLIVSDPKGSAVHILDRDGKTSLRLVTGKGYRLHESAGIAVDSADNIYVADSEHGMIVVFDRNGNFLRYLGTYHGEPAYARPHGLAIDTQNQHLLVVDTPSNQVFELDLEGHELKRAGKNRNGSGTLEFDWPTDIAVNHNHIFVLDRSGTRVQVFDLNLNLETMFDLPRALDPRINRENGLCADVSGNVYISSHRNSTVRVYSPSGHLLASFGQNGRRAGEFSAPEGLWVDAGNRLYVADSENGRVQLFQLKTAQ